MSRERVDKILVDRGLFPTREKAKAAVMAGRVSAGGRAITKAGQSLPVDVELEVSSANEYVSRGGLKLAGALSEFSVPIDGARALDVGASTGGFTDCLLRAGALSVVALDVGYGQLAWSLRTDERVRVMERTNIRSADPESVGAPFDVITVDVSFIGLDKVLPVVATMLGREGHLIALVKPQFEAGKARVGKHGVVRSAKVHTEVLESVVETGRDLGLTLSGATWSPVRGPKGNIEFWVWFSRQGEPSGVNASEMVAAAHESFGE